MPFMNDDYKCLDCEIIFEYTKVYLDDKKCYEEWPEHPKCTSCGSENTKRQITFGGIHVPQHMRSTNTE